MNLIKPKISTSTIVFMAFVAGCSPMTEEEKNADLGPIDVMGQEGMSEIMLNLADPGQAVIFFRERLAEEPENIETKRNLALALVRARQYADAALQYEQIVAVGQATADDRLNYADALVRNGAWEGARTQLDSIPPTVENFRRYFLEALVADHNKQWEKADSFYDIAKGLTTRPGQVYNNWGQSKAARGRLSEAETLFKQAIAADPSLFAAKNNLVISRAKRKVYDLPVIPMTDIERAVLLFNIARQAIDNGDTDIAAGMLDTAIDVHPQHFEPAVALRNSL